MDSSTDHRDRTLDRFLQRAKAEEFENSIDFETIERLALDEASSVDKIAKLWNGEVVSSFEKHQPLVLPESVDGFQLVRLLGKGGFGTVYLATEKATGRPVALKFLHHLRSDKITSFFREAVLLSELKHPRFVSSLHFGKFEGRPYFAMEYVEGITLGKLISTMAQIHANRPEPKPDPLTLRMEWDGGRSESFGDFLLRCMEQTAEGLAFLHRSGLVHRDFKPGNVLVDRSGQCKIADLGIAQLWGEENQGRKLGTIPYMSPEQLKGESLDSRSDIFSFGSTFYEAATLRRLFSGSVVDQVACAILNESSITIPRFDKSGLSGFEPILQRCLEKNKYSRYAHGDQVWSDLKKLARGESLSAIPVKQAPTRRPFSARLLWTCLLLLVPGGLQKQPKVPSPERLERKVDPVALDPEPTPVPTQEPPPPIAPQEKSPWNQGQPIGHPAMPEPPARTEPETPAPAVRVSEPVSSRAGAEPPKVDGSQHPENPISIGLLLNTEIGWVAFFDDYKKAQRFGDPSPALPVLIRPADGAAPNPFMVYAFKVSASGELEPLWGPGRKTIGTTRTQPAKILGPAEQSLYVAAKSLEKPGTGHALWIPEGKTWKLLQSYLKVRKP